MPRNTNPLLQNIGRGASYSGFAPATFQAAVFTPEKEDMSLLQRSFALMDERKRETDKQRAAIKAAIGKVQLHESEDEWKQQFIDKIANKINTASQFGDFSVALEIANEAAGDVASDASLLSRERSNREYQKEFERIQNDRTLDELTKQRWAAMNPYYHNDIKNDKGDIVGGSKWKATFNPVEDVDINKLRALAASMTAEESGSSGGTTTRDVLLDADGNEIKDPSKNFGDAYGIKMTTSKGGSNQFARKSKEKMARVWNSLKADSKILQGLNQKYETYRWAYEDAQRRAADMSLTQEDRDRAAREVESYKTEICDKDGIIYSNAETWAQSRIIPGFADMEYNNRHSVGNSSEHYNENYFAIKQAKSLQAANNNDIAVTEDAGVSGTKISNTYSYTPIWQNSDSFDELYNNNEER